MEIWDTYYSNFNLIKDMTLVRGKGIPDGFFHLACEVIVKHTDGTYLLMQRDSRKHFGEMREATAAGSALQDESPLECTIRELWEETGIVSENLIEIGRLANDNIYAIYAEFLCITNQNKESIILQEGETTDYKWISRDALMNMSQNKLATQRIQKYIEELQQ